MKPVKAVVLGAGNRGEIYAQYSIVAPEKLQIIAVADKNEKRRVLFAEKFGISQDLQFSDWSEAMDSELLDAAIVTLPDALHYDATCKALDRGLHVLLEKPMATTLEQCLDLVARAEISEGILQICHVLRYAPFYRTVKRIIDSGEIGGIVTIEQSENVSYYHYAHSFIRGNWHSREQTGPFLLTKSSHDLDILYWLMDSKPLKISSFGSQTEFGTENKPEGAPDRCLDGCPVKDTCLYFAPRLYIDLIPLLHITRQNGSFKERTLSRLILKYPHLADYPPFNQVREYRGWPVNIITEDPTLEKRWSALETGPYGRCVYTVENHDIVDHQVVSIEFENRKTASFMLHGHSSEEGRYITIYGTKGTLRGRFSTIESWISTTNSLTNAKKDWLLEGIHQDHGGGDGLLISDFVNNVLHQNRSNLTTADESIISHAMAFGGDIARTNSEVINLQDLLK